MIRVSKLSKSFGDFQVLKALSMDFERQGISCILGPSGCGKTTLLNIMAGLEKPDSGDVSFTDNESISIVFQDPVLLPWKTVFNNVVFPIRKFYPADKWKETGWNNLKLVKLDSYSDHYPSQLSKGMKQRTAIARGLGYPADILLMDEPFNSLDVNLKHHIMASVRDEVKTNKKSLIFISHDPDEALFMSDRIFVFKKRPVSSYSFFDVTKATSEDELSRIRSGIIGSMEKNG
jgi:NitT/TauT family transport system ATP-binding protein